MVEKNEFQWNDNLACEWAGYLSEVLLVKQAKEIPAIMAQWKASKQPPSVQRDWEIESFFHTTYNTIYKREGNMFRSHHTGYEEGFIVNHPNFTIHSVKRLSDNSVWIVGDFCKHGNIKSFQIVGDYMYASFESGDVGCQIDIKDLQKQRPILFTTSKGEPIYDNDRYWYVGKTTFSIGSQIAVAKLHDGYRLHYEYFSTKAEAEQYVIENRPCLSLNQALCAYHVDYKTFRKLLDLHLNKKLNQQP